MALRIDKDSKTLMSISQDSTIRLWDLSTGRQLHKLDAGQSAYYEIGFSPDGKFLASCGQSIRLWDAKTYRVIREFGNSALTKYGWTHCLAFSPDGKTLLAGNQDGMIHFWDLTSGKEINRVQAHSKKKKECERSPSLQTGNTWHPRGVMMVCCFCELRRPAR